MDSVRKTPRILNLKRSVETVWLITTIKLDQKKKCVLLLKNTKINAMLERAKPQLMSSQLKTVL